MNAIVEAAREWLEARRATINAPTHKEPLKGGGFITLFDDRNVLDRLGNAEAALAKAVNDLRGAA